LEAQRQRLSVGEDGVGLGSASPGVEAGCSPDSSILSHLVRLSRFGAHEVFQLERRAQGR